MVGGARPTGRKADFLAACPADLSQDALQETRSMAKSKSNSGQAADLSQRNYLHSVHALALGGPKDGELLRMHFGRLHSCFIALWGNGCTPADAERVLSFWAGYDGHRQLVESCLDRSGMQAERADILLSLLMAYDMAGQLVGREAALRDVPAAPFAAMHKARLEAWNGPRLYGIAPAPAAPAEPSGYKDALNELIAKLAAAKLPAEAQGGQQAPPPPPTDLIAIAVVLSEYTVSSRTISTQVKAGILHDYRPPGAPKNAPRILSRAEVASRYQRK